MIALLCALLGLGTSFVPEVLGCFKKNHANQQELAMREATAKYAAWLSISKNQGAGRAGIDRRDGRARCS